MRIELEVPPWQSGAYCKFSIFLDIYDPFRQDNFCLGHLLYYDRDNIELKEEMLLLANDAITGEFSKNIAHKLYYHLFLFNGIIQSYCPEHFSIFKNQEMLVGKSSGESEEYPRSYLIKHLIRPERVRLYE